MWVLGIVSVLVPALGALYWDWYRTRLDDQRRLAKPPGMTVFLATLALGAIGMFVLVALIVMRSMTGMWGDGLDDESFRAPPRQGLFEGAPQ